MNRFTYILLMLLYSAALCAKVSVKIEMSDGSITEYDTLEIDSLSMIEPVPTSVTDVEGRKYRVGVAGSSYWMLENLYVTLYDTLSHLRGTVLSESSDSTYLPYVKTGDYGTLYNWSAAIGLETEEEAVSQTQSAQSRVQGICPNKYHLPSTRELSLVSERVGNSGSNPLRSPIDWQYEHEELFQWGESSPDGFMSYPDGYAKGVEHKRRGYIASYWGADAMSESSACGMALTEAGSLTLGSEDKRAGRSVRCIWDGQTDRDWLYVYKKDTVDRYRTDKIVSINISDDESDGYMYDEEGNGYATKRYGKTNWMIENLKRVRGLSSYDGDKNTFCSYYVPSASCGSESTVYYSFAAAMNITETEVSRIFGRLGGENTEAQVQGVCPVGWRLPQRNDFEKIRSQIVSGKFRMPLQSLVYFDGTAFSPGAEGVFWVSDCRCGYGYYGSERRHFIDGIPHIDMTDGYEGRLGYVRTESVLPAMPCRCVKDMKEPLLHCTYTGGEGCKDYGIWEFYYPMIYFEKNDDGQNSMRVRVREDSDSEYTESQGYFNTIEFKVK